MLACLLCVLAFSAGTQAAAAATWQEQRDAGLRAFADADYAGAAERLATALTAARDHQASPEEEGAILERLTTAYFAVRLFSRAEDAIAEWDAILAASADEPWAVRQRGQRDVLSNLVAEVRGQTEPETPPGASPPDAPPASESTADSSQGADETFAPNPEADTPFVPDEGTSFEPDEDASFGANPDTSFNPDQPFLMPQAESPGTAAETAEETVYTPPAAGLTAIHLVSLTNPEGAAASWKILQESYPEVLADKDLEVRQVEIEGQGTFYRLYAVPFPDAATAGQACKALARVQQYCAVVSLD